MLSKKSELLGKYGLCSEKIRNIYLKRNVRHTQMKKTLMATTDACHRRSAIVFSFEKQRRAARNIKCELRREVQILK